MNKSKRSSSVVTRTGALTTPYATRSKQAVRTSDYPGSVRHSLFNNSPYSPLTDPHLQHFYQSKLVSSLTKTRPRSVPSTPSRSSSRPQSARLRVHSVSSYRVTVRTGHTGTPAKAYITLTGSKGRVLRQRLSKGGCKDFTFQPGSVEVFRVRGCEVGTLKSVTVENVGLKVGDGWFLESVSVANQNGEKWTCPFNQWLSLHHSDCQLTRENRARPYTAKSPQRLTYSLAVHTGDVRGAGTEAHVFVTITGSKRSSPKTQLAGAFARNSQVTATMETDDLGRVLSLTIEHDNTGFGPDWFLDYLTLSYADTTIFFPCAQWLSRTEGDGLISRTLTPTSHSPRPFVSKSYIVTVRTGSQRGAGTDANVYVTLVGSHGNSGERRLDNDPANFERGRTDTFHIACSDLGELSKVVVRHDNTGLHPGWFCDSVSVACEGGEVLFPCGRWLEMCDGCGGVLQVELEPGLELAENAVKEPGVRYVITTETGTLPGASTTANVYAELHGSHGNSGRLWLDESGRSFISGAVDEFTVESVCDVGEVESVTIGHDNSGISPGWFLKQVCVRSVRGGVSWVCPCDHWLCMDTGDGRIERELHPLTNQGTERGRGTWTVHVWTSDIRGAGTDANVTLQIHGSHGDSDVIPLGDGIANFEQGEHDVFRNVPVSDGVGHVEAVTVCHDGTRPYPDWHLDRMMVVNELTGEACLCECSRWLKASADGTGAKVRLKAVLQEVPLHTNTPTKHETTPTSPSSRGRSLTSQYVSQLRGEQSSEMDKSHDTIPYTVHVMAGTPPVCDPSPFLVITLIGHTCSSQPIRLQSLNSTGFVPRKSETFSIECEDVGHVSRLKVRLEGPSHCPPWLIEQINIDSPTSGHTHQFPYGQGLSPALDVTLEELSDTGTSSLALNTDSQELTGYEVKVYTSDKKGAGTRNTLHIVLRGEKASSRPFTVKNRSMLRRGQIDSFQLATPPLGALQSIQVAHSPAAGEHSQDNSTWHLFQIVLKELATNIKSTFPCRQWIPASCSEGTLSYTSLARTDSQLVRSQH